MLIGVASLIVSLMSHYCYIFVVYNIITRSSSKAAAVAVFSVVTNSTDTAYGLTMHVAVGICGCGIVTMMCMILHDVHDFE